MQKLFRVGYVISNLHASKQDISKLQKRIGAVLGLPAKAAAAELLTYRNCMLIGA